MNTELTAAAAEHQAAADAITAANKTAEHLDITPEVHTDPEGAVVICWQTFDLPDGRTLTVNQLLDGSNEPIYVTLDGDWSDPVIGADNATALAEAATAAANLIRAIG